MASVFEFLLVMAGSFLVVGFVATLLVMEVGWVGETEFDRKVASVLLAGLLVIGLGWLLYDFLG